MKDPNRPYLLFTGLALVAASTLALTGAFAGPTATPEAPLTKTTSPIHSMMGWMATNVVGDLESPCPSCPKAEKAWRTWFAGGKDVKLAGLRDQLVADGWTADRYIGFFQEMAKGKSECGSDCGENGGKDCGDCDDCPSKGDCDDCPSKGSCGDKAPSSGCGGCPSKTADPETSEDDTAAK